MKRERKQPVHYRIDRALLARIDAYAQEQGARTRSGAIAVLLDLGLCNSRHLSDRLMAMRAEIAEDAARKVRREIVEFLQQKE